MAPKKGMSGGSSSDSVNDNSGSSNTSMSCTTSDAFQQIGMKGLVSIGVTVGLIYITLLIMTIWRRRKVKSSREILSWFHFGPSLLLKIASVALLTTFFVADECGSFDNVLYQKSLIGVYWTATVSEVLLLATVLLPVCRALGDSVNVDTQRTTTMHSINMAIVGAAALGALGLATYVRLNYEALVLNVDDGTIPPIVTASTYVYAGFYVIYFFICTIAAANLLVPLWTMKKHGIAPGSLRVWLPLLAIFLPLKASASMIYHFLYGMKYSNVHINVYADLIWISCIHAFLIMSYVATIFIGSHKAILSVTNKQDYDEIKLADDPPQLPNINTSYSPLYQFPPQQTEASQGLLANQYERPQGQTQAAYDYQSPLQSSQSQPNSTSQTQQSQETQQQENIVSDQRQSHLSVNQQYYQLHNSAHSQNHYHQHQQQHQHQNQTQHQHQHQHQHQLQQHFPQPSTAQAHSQVQRISLIPENQVYYPPPPQSHHPYYQSQAPTSNRTSFSNASATQQPHQLASATTRYDPPATTHYQLQPTTAATRYAPPTTSHYHLQQQNAVRLSQNNLVSPITNPAHAHSSAASWRSSSGQTVVGDIVEMPAEDKKS